MKSLANYAAVMSVQGHCRLIELKLCNLITCIGGKTGGLGANWGPDRPSPALAYNRACWRERLQWHCPGHRHCSALTVTTSHCCPGNACADNEMRHCVDNTAVLVLYIVNTWKTPTSLLSMRSRAYCSSSRLSHVNVLSFSLRNCCCTVAWCIWVIK